MVDIEKAVIARLKKGGENFEVLVDAQQAVKLKKGENIDMNEVLAEFKIFSDAKKGLLATESKFQEVFGTNEVDEIAKQVILKGDVQFTADQKRKSMEEKRTRIINSIAANAIDAQTKLPIPKTRIELAFEQLKIKIGEHESDEYEIERILKQMRTLIPIRFETVIVETRIKHQYSSKVIGIIKREFPNASQIWDDEGNLLVKMKVPAGRVDELRSKINQLTQGTANFETKEN